MQPRRLRTLTGVTSLRLTPEEEKKIAEAAARRSLTKSQWLRQIILQAVSGSQDTRLILAEVIGARAVVVALLERISTGKPVTDEVIKAVIEQVNLVKSAAADKRIQAGNGGGQ